MDQKTLNHLRDYYRLLIDLQWDYFLWKDEPRRQQYNIITSQYYNQDLGLKLQEVEQLYFALLSDLENK